MKKFLALLVCVSFFMSCAGTTINPANLVKPHARGNFVNRIYLGAVADYQRYAALPNLTDEAKQLLRVKRKILVGMGDPLYGAITIFNNHIQTGVPITDQMWNAMLDKLLEMESGWYTQAEMYEGKAKPQTFSLDPKTVLSKARPEQQTDENLNKILRAESVRAKLVDDSVKSQAIWEGLLIELIRTGIHALRTLLQMRELDNAALAAAYNESYVQFKAFDVTTLAEIN